jgi:hypothetical protein
VPVVLHSKPGSGNGPDSGSDDYCVPESRSIVHDLVASCGLWRAEDFPGSYLIYLVKKSQKDVRSSPVVMAFVRFLIFQR